MCARLRVCVGVRVCSFEQTRAVRAHTHTHVCVCVGTRAGTFGFEASFDMLTNKNKHIIH